MYEIGSTLMRIEVWDLLNARPGMELVEFDWSTDDPNQAGNYDLEERKVTLNTNNQDVQSLAGSIDGLVDLAAKIIERKEALGDL